MFCVLCVVQPFANSDSVSDIGELPAELVDGYGAMRGSSRTDDD